MSIRCGAAWIMGATCELPLDHEGWHQAAGSKWGGMFMTAQWEDPDPQPAAIQELTTTNQRLRAIIRRAPHDMRCPALPGYLRSCTCWKADALGA